MTDYVFVHGGGQGGWVWDETIAALRLQKPDSGDRYLALDAPGCGSKRDRDTNGLTMAHVAAELVAEIESAGFRDVVLVGHSQAGQALPIMAKQRPALIRRLVYITCSAPLPGQSVMQMLGKGLQGSNEEEVGWPVDPATSDPAERAAMMFGSDMTPVQCSAFLAKLGRDTWPLATYSESAWEYDHLAAIPASYLVCLQDRSLPAAWQRRFAERLHVGHVVTVDAGHQAMNSRPHTVAEVLRIEAAR